MKEEDGYADEIDGYVTPPEHQGQIVCVSYARAGQGVYRRTVDQSQQRPTVVEWVSWDDYLEHDDDYHPWNTAPHIPEGVWKVVNPGDWRHRHAFC